MIDFGLEDRKEVWDLGHQAADSANEELFSDPIKLAFEKIFHPYLLLTKKNYAGLHYEETWEKPDKINSKGIETVRRDKAFLVRETVKQCLEFILREQDIPKTVEYLKNRVDDLINRRIDFDEFIITTRLSKEKYKSKTPHSELVKREKKRDPLSAPKLGERVKYVLIDTGPRSKTFEMSEDPKRALMQDKPINIEYYLEKKLKPVIHRLFNMVFSEEQMSYIFARPKKIIKKPVTKKKGTIGYFFGLKKKCLSCNKGIKEGVVCTQCEYKKNSLYDKIMGEKDIIHEKLEEVKKKCKECQGEGTVQLECTNDDCELFFKRIQYGREDRKSVV